MKTNSNFPKQSLIITSKPESIIKSLYFQAQKAYHSSTVKQLLITFRKILQKKGNLEAKLKSSNSMHHSFKLPNFHHVSPRILNNQSEHYITIEISHDNVIEKIRNIESKSRITQTGDNGKEKRATEGILVEPYEYENEKRRRRSAMVCRR